MKCPYCHSPLTEIDYYGEVLVGYVECNRWGKPAGSPVGIKPNVPGLLVSVQMR
jgi:hypothetical protein